MFLASSEQNECKGHIPPWGKKRDCEQREVLSLRVLGYFSLFRKSLGIGRQLDEPNYLAFPHPPNNQLLETIKDPDTETTRVTCLRLLAVEHLHSRYCCILYSWRVPFKKNYVNYDVNYEPPPHHPSHEVSAHMPHFSYNFSEFTYCLKLFSEL